MSALQRRWVRLIGITIIAAFASSWFFERKTKLPTIAQVRMSVADDGIIGDLFCRSFAERVLREDIATLLDISPDDIEALRQGISARIRDLSNRATQSKEESNASLSGGFFVSGHLDDLSDPTRQVTAKTELAQAYSDCYARLNKYGVPMPPSEPEPGSTEWYIQNR